MVAYICSNIVLIATSLLLFSNCSAYVSRGLTSHSDRYHTLLHAGFGAANPKAKEQSGQDALVNPQLKSIDVQAPCPCSSGLVYKDCCKVHHDTMASISSSGPGSVIYPDPEALTRARYSAFALGLATYVIDTSHPLHRDYARHSGSSLDPKKARKAWEKEIITKNSEVFDFLKLELLVGDEKRIQRENITLIDNEESVAFRILVRRRNDGSLITFQESSVYVPMPLNHIPLGLKSSSSSTGVSSGKKKEKFVKLESKVEAVEEVVPVPVQSSNGWLYVRGIVKAVPDDIAKRIMSEAPQFLNNLSIRDRW